MGCGFYCSLSFHINFFTSDVSNQVAVGKEKKECGARIRLDKSLL